MLKVDNIISLWSAECVVSNNFRFPQNPFLLFWEFLLFLNKTNPLMEDCSNLYACQFHNHLNHLHGHKWASLPLYLETRTLGRQYRYYYNHPMGSTLGNFFWSPLKVAEEFYRPCMSIIQNMFIKRITRFANILNQVISRYTGYLII